MDVRSLAYRTDLEILRLAGSEIEDQGDRLVVRTPANPTYYWGNFYLLERPPAADEVAGLIEAFDADFPDSDAPRLRRRRGRRPVGRARPAGRGRAGARRRRR